MAGMFKNLGSKLRAGKLFGGSNADLPGYSPEGPGSEIAPSSGGRRRRRSLRRPKRGSRAHKKSHKRSRKHYGGKSQQEQEEEQQEEQEEEEQKEQEEEDTSSDDGKSSNDSNRTGGSRRRKGHRGKKTRGKTSSWIKHVLQFAKDNKMKYFQALKDKRCRATYKSNKK
jgi:hypothetical protein